MCWTYIGIRDIISIMSAPNFNALNASNGSGEAVRATVQAPRTIGSTSLTVNATTDWPTGTFIATTGTLLSTGKLDPATVQVFYGTTAGTVITITAFAAGYTDQGNAIDDVVVLKPTTEWANIVATGLQSTTQFPGQFANFVEPAGGVWSTSSGLVGGATAGNVWFSGVRSAMANVASHTFTASKDTYVDYNPTTLAFTYVAVTNGAAEPAITSGCVRITKCVTSGSAITAFYQTSYQTPRSATTSSNPHKFSAYRNTAWTTGGASAFNVVPIDTITYDTSGDFSISNNRFIAPIAGFYFFTGTVSTSTTNVWLIAGLLKNGTLVKRGQGNLNSAGAINSSNTVSGLLQLAAGDYIQLALFSNNASQGGLTGADTTYFDGEFRTAT